MAFGEVPPYLLDEVFKDPKGAPQAFLKHPRVVAAFKEAETAFGKREQEFKQNGPGYMSGSPPTAAREAFLEALGLKISGQETHG